MTDALNVNAVSRAPLTEPALLILLQYVWASVPGVDLLQRCIIHVYDHMKRKCGFPVLYGASGWMANLPLGFFGGFLTFLRQPVRGEKEGRNLKRMMKMWNSSEKDSSTDGNVEPTAVHPICIMAD